MAAVSSNIVPKIPSWILRELRRVSGDFPAIYSCPWSELSDSRSRFKVVKADRNCCFTALTEILLHISAYFLVWVLWWISPGFPIPAVDSPGKVHGFVSGLWCTIGFLSNFLKHLVLNTIAARGVLITRAQGWFSRAGLVSKPLKWRSHPTTVHGIDDSMNPLCLSSTSALPFLLEPCPCFAPQAIIDPQTGNNELWLCDLEGWTIVLLSSAVLILNYTKEKLVTLSRHSFDVIGQSIWATITRVQLANPFW